MYYRYVLYSKKSLSELLRDTKEVERMIKILDKIFRKQALEPLNPRILDPFLPIVWENNLK